MKPLSSLIDGDDTQRASRAVELRNMDTDDLASCAVRHVTVIHGLLDDIDLIADTLVDRDALAHLLLDLRDVKAAVDVVFKETEKALLSEAGTKSFETVRGRFDVKRKTKRSGWRHDELVPVLVAKAMTERHFDGDSGEVESEGHAVARVLRDCISFGAGKVTGLRARGIQPDEWCIEEDDGWSVMLPGSAR